MRIREPWPLARTRQRRREFAAVFAGVPRQSLGDGLEIGAGDGFLASLLSPYCRSFVTTDFYRARLADGADACAQAPPRRLVCDARRLPFTDASFDFIFSSSVLEHVCDRQAALAEMHRCLRPGGLMLHITPSRTWKVLQLILYYPHLLLGGIDLLLQRLPCRASPSLSQSPPPSPTCAAAEAPRPSKPVQPCAIAERWSDRRTWGLSARTIARGAVPRVHGEFAGHISEWTGFGARAWINEFETAGFDVRSVLLLPLYSGYGFGMEWARSFGERLGLSSHNAFVLTKRGDVASAQAVRWFESAPAPMLLLGG